MASNVNCRHATNSMSSSCNLYLCYYTIVCVERLLLFNYICMLYTIAVILLILWLLGLVTSFTLGGFIHLLLVIAIVMVLVRIIRGEDPFK